MPPCSARPLAEQAGTLFWYDLETFGLDPIHDRIAQFAGVRTDLSLNVIDKPRVLYCKPPADYLPDPASCLITGITPQTAESNGLPEAEFVAAIRAEFLRPGTCVAGFNNLRFDDEVLRHALYRNLFDPYEREWRSGNSRWDIIDMVRLVAALRPEGISWPTTDEGVPTVRLELLTAANGIPHAGAHDALSDVWATIAVAGLIKGRQPRLFDYVFAHRGKRQAAELLQLGRFEPLIHVSGRYPAQRLSLAIVVPLVRHPVNQNGVIVYDLEIDPTPLIELPIEQIQHRVFTLTNALESPEQRIPLKTVHLNKCPVLAPVTVLRSSDAVRLAIDRERIAAHLSRIRREPGIAEKVAAVFAAPPLEEATDPDAMLYRGGFLGAADRGRLEQLHALPPERWKTAAMDFDDPRLPEMVFRFRARNYRQTLDREELERWEQFRMERLNEGGMSGIRTLPAYLRALAELEDAVPVDSRRQAILADLRAYGEQLAGRNRPNMAYT